MRSISRINSIGALLALTLWLPCAAAHAIHLPLRAAQNDATLEGRNVSRRLFGELEELSRVVDIAYCVGVTGIRQPFECAGRCAEFPGWELVDTWNTGILMSDSCGYIALDHAKERIIVAFRGTYSIANTIVDLSTIPQEYVPYPGDPDDPEDGNNSNGQDASWWDRVTNPLSGKHEHGKTTAEHSKVVKPEHKCENCTVHSGFFTSWQAARKYVLPQVSSQHKLHPTYAIHLVGHSLGGAVSALAGIEFELRGWNPTITTFGEPRIGNLGLRNWMDRLFGLGQETPDGERYRRVTHADDPVPLLPLAEWGFLMHAGEIYISKPSLSPSITDLEICSGDEDSRCIAGEDEPGVESIREPNDVVDAMYLDETDLVEAQRWGLPARYKLWQLFFAHRDYFWRLGLCVPGGDPYDWGRGKYGDDGEKDDEAQQDDNLWEL